MSAHPTDVRTAHCHYRIITHDSGDPGYVNRILVGTATTGNIRIEWHQAVSGLIVPCNWSHVRMVQPIPAVSWSYVHRHQVADAQNVIVKQAVEGDFQWLCLLEHDTCPPPDLFVRFNEYMRDEQVPVVSGLYYTKSRPSEPLIYRGRGTGAYLDWQPGDKVWCDGVPTGCLLIHMGIIRAMWQESEPYTVYGVATRRVFDTPRRAWFDPESNQYNTLSGTSDLEWCTRVMTEGFFAKGGWPGYADKQYPFLVDTAIRCVHIDQNGTTYP